MSPQIAAEIQAAIQSEQEAGRQKYGKDANNFEHDDRTPDAAWHGYIADHNERAKESPPMERRQHLLKVAGLAISAVESFDRKRRIPLPCVNLGGSWLCGYCDQDTRKNHGPCPKRNPENAGGMAAGADGPHMPSERKA